MPNRRRHRNSPRRPKRYHLPHRSLSRRRRHLLHHRFLVRVLQPPSPDRRSTSTATGSNSIRARTSPTSPPRWEVWTRFILSAVCDAEKLSVGGSTPGSTNSTPRPKPRSALCEKHPSLARRRKNVNRANRERTRTTGRSATASPHQKVRETTKPHTCVA